MKRTLVLVLGAALGFAAIHAAARQPVSPGTASSDLVPPSTPAGKQLAWFLDYLNGKAPLGEPADRFTESFLKQVSSEKLKAILTSAKSTVFKDGATLTTIKPGATDSNLVAVVQGGEMLLEVLIGTDAAGKMEGLLLKPALPPKVNISSW